ncbi:Xaa-Pro peptidase family protein [Planctomicrobium sp.]|jgi:Xaa-Pro aminopeptidase|nr:Xaa-Pro peptidase family protein [Planctomicrobium sp.]MDB4743358.1 Xaa-Pro peptidase family protein [Planctomicrobium sp.]
MSNQFLTRRDQLRDRIRSTDIDGMLVTVEKNVSYLTGFSGDSTWLILTEETELLLSDFRYITQLEEECPDVELFIRTSKIQLTEALSGEVQERGIKRLGFESHAMTFGVYQSLQESLPDVEFVPVSWQVEELRAIKDAGEIEEIREAVRLAEKGFAFLQAILTPQATEQQLAYELEHAVRNFGGEELSFHPIIAVGDRSAMPHYRPGKLKIAESPILLVDWGAQTHLGYKSDLTRTMLTRSFSEEAKFETIYKTVLEAQRLAIEMIAPGVSCQTVDAVARDYINDAGFGEYFDHGLGHGIGLDIHELPRFSQSSDAPLEAGMVVTVEPGIYLGGWGGVRIEDDILVTDTGCEVLSSVPKDWESVRISV